VSFAYRCENGRPPGWRFLRPPTQWLEAAAFYPDDRMLDGADFAFRVRKTSWFAPVVAPRRKALVGRPRLLLVKIRCHGWMKPPLSPPGRARLALRPRSDRVRVRNDIWVWSRAIVTAAFGGFKKTTDALVPEKTPATSEAAAKTAS